MTDDDEFKPGVGRFGRSRSVLRVRGRLRDVPRDLRQLQWFYALFAYAEVQNNPSLAITTDLERTRTVPTSRWHYHRLLLDAHAALLCRFAKQRVASLRRKVIGMIEPGALCETVEEGLGEYQGLDAAQLVERCPFFMGDEVANTYWEGRTAELEATEAPARTVSVVLGGVRDCTPKVPWIGTRHLITVAGHAFVRSRERDTWLMSFDEPTLEPLELCYSFWIRELGASNHEGAMGLSPTTLVDAIPLASGRAAWAVAVGIVESGPVLAERDALEGAAGDAELALGAAVELIATLVRGQRQAAEQPWQLPIMSAAQVARDSVSAIWDAFSTFGTGVYARAWRAPGPPRVYDSKYLYTLSRPSSALALKLRAARYETALEVAIGQEPVSVSDQQVPARHAESGTSARRWSMLYFRGIKGEDRTGG